MIRTAVILTVYNRKEITLQGLRSLSKAIEVLGEDYTFDIYMTDDGCTDGTSEAVVKEFPDVHIIQGDGKLYWSGGMRKAWQAAIDSGVKYDYYLWFNDDADLYDDALVTMFKSYNDAGGNAIISGAFCDGEGKASYGGRTKEKKIVVADGTLQDVYLMNGNFVLIPEKIEKTLGNIDPLYVHSLGDWDYGCRAIKSGFRVFLTSSYVGVTDRHDNNPEVYRDNRVPLYRRLRMLYSCPFYISITFYFTKKYIGLLEAIKVLIILHAYAICPRLYKTVHDKRTDVL